MAEDPVHVTLWGPSAAGKTVLLAQLYIEAKDGDGDWGVFPTEESYEFIRQMRSSMAATNAFPDATAVGSVERIVYRFHHRLTGTEIVLEMEDRAGKDYEELASIEFPASIYSSVVVANNTLYVTTNTHLYAYKIGE